MFIRALGLGKCTDLQTMVWDNAFSPKGTLAFFSDPKQKALEILNDAESFLASKLFTCDLKERQDLHEQDKPYYYCQYSQLCNSWMVVVSTQHLEKSMLISLFKYVNEAYTFNQMKEANPTELNRLLQVMVNDPLQYIKPDPSFLKIEKLQGEVNQTKHIMVDNLSKALHRGEQIDVLLEKADQLETLSDHFEGGAKKLNSCCSIL